MRISPRALADRRFVCAWSGGKDACLALHRVVAGGGRPQALLCVVDANGRRSRGHSLPVCLLRRQAESLGFPLVTVEADREHVEVALMHALADLHRDGVAACVFGDIDVVEHRRRTARLCESAGVDCCLPLWGESRTALLDELLGLGMRVTIVGLRPQSVDRGYLGREFTRELAAELAADDVDVAGEHGEYHTMVTDAPLFGARVSLAWDSVVARDGGLYLDLDGA